MFGLISNFLQPDEINDDGVETSPAIRLFEAAKPVVEEVLSNAAKVAAEVANDDLEYLRK